MMYVPPLETGSSFKFYRDVTTTAQYAFKESCSADTSHRYMGILVRYGHWVLCLCTYTHHYLGY